MWSREELILEQAWTNENANGLLRQYFLEGTDLSEPRAKLSPRWFAVGAEGIVIGSRPTVARVAEISGSSQAPWTPMRERDGA